MIRWYIGPSGSGKTTQAAKDPWLLAAREAPSIPLIHLDGDALREVWPGLGFTRLDRYEQNLRLARLAKLLHDQGSHVILSSICPYRDLRRQIDEIVPEIEWVPCRVVHDPHPDDVDFEWDER